MRRVLGLVLLAILAAAISGCSTAEVSEKEASDWGKAEGDAGKDANSER